MIDLGLSDVDSLQLSDEEVAVASVRQTQKACRSKVVVLHVGEERLPDNVTNSLAFVVRHSANQPGALTFGS